MHNILAIEGSLEEFSMKYNNKYFKSLNLKTGDIVLFSGKTFYSKVIKFFTRSKWSHVGLIIKYKKKYYLFEASENLESESTTISTSSTGKVQFNSLENILNSYEGTFAIRRLNLPLTAYNCAQLREFMNKSIGKPYEQNLSELIKSAVDLPNWMLNIPLLGPIFSFFCRNKPDLSSLFCSELVVEAYKKMGFVYNNALPSNEYVPADLSSKSKHLFFKIIFSLEEEI